MYLGLLMLHLDRAYSLVIDLLLSSQIRDLWLGLRKVKHNFLQNHK